MISLSEISTCGCKHTTLLQAKNKMKKMVKSDGNMKLALGPFLYTEKKPVRKVRANDFSQ